MVDYFFYANKNGESASSKDHYEIFPYSRYGKRLAKVRRYTFWSTMAYSCRYTNGYGLHNKLGNLNVVFSGKSIGEALEKCRHFVSKLNEEFDIDKDFIAYSWDGIAFYISIPYYIYNGDSGDFFLPIIHQDMLNKMDKCYMYPCDIPDYVTYVEPETLEEPFFFRLNNIKMSDGLYKIPIKAHELFSLDEAGLSALRSKPRLVSILIKPEIRSKALTDIYVSCRDDIQVAYGIEALTNNDECLVDFFKYTSKRFGRLPEDKQLEILEMLKKSNDLHDDNFVGNDIDTESMSLHDKDNTNTSEQKAAMGKTADPPAEQEVDIKSESLQDNGIIDTSVPNEDIEEVSSQYNAGEDTSAQESDIEIKDKVQVEQDIDIKQEPLKDKETNDTSSTNEDIEEVSSQ